MSRVSLGDASLTNLLARQGVELRAQVQRAATEVTTGRQSDLAATLRGDVSPLLAIEASLARLSAFRTTASDAAFHAAAQQSVLSGLSALTTEIATPLLGSRNMPTPAQVDALASDARARLASAVGLLNTQTAGRAVFSGVQTGTPPLPSSEDILAALDVASTGATTAGQVRSAVIAWFSDPGGYAAAYQGGDPLSSTAVAPGEVADLSTTALDPAIRDTLAGLAMAALLDRGQLAGNPDERAKLAAAAGQQLIASGDSRVTLSARIGTVEAQIDAARSRTGAEETALRLLRADIGAVDPYEAATRLENARSQLESLYLITARVSRLSLTEFLR